MKYRYRAIIFALLFSAGLCAAQAATGERNNLPIQIKSTELLTDNAARTATFVGKVSARQGDITIFSDKLVIHYSAGDKDVDKVEAFGNVRIIQENRRGEAEHAVYENKIGRAHV